MLNLEPPTQPEKKFRRNFIPTIGMVMLLKDMNGTMTQVTAVDYYEESLIGEKIKAYFDIDLREEHDPDEKSEDGFPVRMHPESIKKLRLTGWRVEEG